METTGSKADQTTTDIAPASIVDLKAELYRKQQEYELRKSLGNEHNSYVKGKKISGTKKKTMWTGKNAGVQVRSEADVKDRQFTDTDKLEASRLALEAKSRLYDQMAKMGDNAEDEDGHSLYLVDFERKYIDEAMEMRKKRLNNTSSSATTHDNGDDNDKDIVGDVPDVDVPDEEKWVDFVDSFGRSRRCMKKDLPRLQAADRRTDTTNEQPDLMSADMQREMLREKWEKEQRDMLENQDTVHYANVQFDERRAHGVGYYQFSKDEEVRQKEMERLKTLREETESQREAKKKLADKRKAILSARLDKVKQRRLAQGKPIPPPEAQSVTVKEEEGPSGSPDIHNDRIENPAIDEPEETSKPSIREWDLGKPGLLIPRKPEKPKSWVNPREMRDEEFAPPSFYYPSAAPAVKPKSTVQSIPLPNETPPSTSSSTLTVTADIPLPPDTTASTAATPMTAGTTASTTAATTKLSHPTIDIILKSLRNQS